MNTHTPGRQEYAKVARATDGSFVVVWQSAVPDSSEFDIHGRRFAADGMPLGAVFPVHGATLGDQRYPAISTLSGGGFVVAWEGSTTGYLDIDVFHRRFDAGGAPTGLQQRTNIYTTGLQQGADVESDGTGGFVVTWSGAGAGGETHAVFARAYDDAGAPRGGEFRVSRVGGSAYGAVVARTGEGEFVAAYSDSLASQPSGDLMVLGRRFNSAGERIGSEFQISSGAGYHGEVWPAISSAPAGAFVVGWIQSDFHHSEPHARRFSAAATPLGDPFDVAFSGSSIAVGHDAQGGFLLTWDRSGSAETSQAFSAGGSPLGGPFAAVETGSNGFDSQIAFDGESNLVFVWRRHEGGESRTEIDARLFRGVSLLVDGFESGDPGRWSSISP